MEDDLPILQQNHGCDNGYVSAVMRQADGDGSGPQLPGDGVAQKVFACSTWYDEPVESTFELRGRGFGSAEADSPRRDESNQTQATPDPMEQDVDNTVAVHNEDDQNLAGAEAGDGVDVMQEDEQAGGGVVQEHDEVIRQGKEQEHEEMQHENEDDYELEQDVEQEVEQDAGAVQRRC